MLVLAGAVDHGLRFREWSYSEPPPARYHLLEIRLWGWLPQNPKRLNSNTIHFINIRHVTYIVVF